MEYLNKQLAQEIVDRTMNIIDRNINVMDNHAVIIGSGDQNRIDDVHAGAEVVLESGTGFEIEETEAKSMQGVKAGINLPIRFEGKILGVIGITGPPAEVRSYGELVRMAAELSLKQAVLMNEIQWDERLKEELISQIIHYDGKLDPLFFERSKRLGIDLDIPRSAMILRVPDRKKALSYLKNKLGNDDLFFMLNDGVGLLKKVPESRNKLAIQSSLKSIAAGWISGLKDSYGMAAKASVGGHYDGIAGLAKSFRQAEKTLVAGMKLGNDEDVFIYDEYYLPVFMLTAAESGLTEEFISFSEALQQKDPKGELADTLKVFIQTSGDMNGTARKLFIHRNTLRYRLDKLTEITGRDPRKTADLLHLYLSLLKDQLM